MRNRQKAVPLGKISDCFTFFSVLNISRIPEFRILEFYNSGNGEVEGRSGTRIANLQIWQGTFSFWAAAASLACFAIRCAAETKPPGIL